MPREEILGTDLLNAAFGRVNNMTTELYDGIGGGGDPTLRTDLANPDDPAKGSHLLAYQTERSLAAKRTAWDKLSESVSVRDYGARGSANTANLTANTTAGSPVIDASGIGDLVVGDGIVVHGANSDTQLSDLTGRITAISAGAGGRYNITIHRNATVTVSNKPLLQTDVPALQAAIDAGHGVVYVPEHPTGGKWNFAGEVVLPGARSTTPRPLTIISEGKWQFIGNLNAQEARRPFRGVLAAAGDQGVYDLTVIGLDIDGRASQLPNIQSGDDARCIAFAILSDSDDRAKHPRNVHLFDCTFRDWPGVPVFWKNVKGGTVANCRSLGKNWKGGWIFNSACEDILIANPYHEEGTQDDCFALNSSATTNASLPHYHASGEAGGGQCRRISLIGGILKVHQESRGGSCMALRAPRDFTSVGTVMEGGKDGAIMLQESDNDFYWGPANINISGFVSRFTALPFYDDHPDVLGYKAGGPGIRIKTRKGRAINIGPGRIEFPGGDGVYIENRDALEEFNLHDIEIYGAGMPRNDPVDPSLGYLIKRASVEGYTNGQRVVDYKGHPSAPAVDTQVGVRALNLGGVTTSMWAKFHNLTISRSRLQNFYVDDSARFEDLDIHKLFVREAYTLGETAGSPATDVDSVYIGGTTAPVRARIDGFVGRDTRASKRARSHFRFGTSGLKFGGMMDASDAETLSGEGITSATTAITTSTQATTHALLQLVSAPTGPATNLAAAATSEPDGTYRRRRIDARNAFKGRITFRIGGTLVAATKLKVQYVTTGNMNATTGWTDLYSSNGNHTSGNHVSPNDFLIPAAVRINDLVLRAVLYDGDGAADPTIDSCTLTLYGV